MLSTPAFRPSDYCPGRLLDSCDDLLFSLSTRRGVCCVVAVLLFVDCDPPTTLRHKAARPSISFLTISVHSVTAPGAHSGSFHASSVAQDDPFATRRVSFSHLDPSSLLDVQPLRWSLRRISLCAKHTAGVLPLVVPNSGVLTSLQSFFFDWTPQGQSPPVPTTGEPICLSCSLIFVSTEFSKLNVRSTTFLGVARVPRGKDNDSR